MCAETGWSVEVMILRADCGISTPASVSMSFGDIITKYTLSRSTVFA